MCIAAVYVTGATVLQRSIVNWSGRVDVYTSVYVHSAICDTYVV